MKMRIISDIFLEINIDSKFTILTFTKNDITLFYIEINHKILNINEV